MGDGDWAGPVVGAAIGLAFIHGLEEHHRKYHKKGDHAWWDDPKKSAPRKRKSRTKSAK